MSYGLQVLNTSGTIQIDEKYANIIVIERGFISATPNGSGGIIPIPAGVTNFEIFIRPTVYNRYISTNLDNRLWCPTTTSCEYIVCRPVSVISTVASGYGLNVYNASGQLTFSSNTIFPRMTAIVDWPTPLAANVVRNYALPITAQLKWVSVRNQYRINTPFPLTYLSFSLSSETSLNLQSNISWTFTTTQHIGVVAHA